MRLLALLLLGVCVATPVSNADEGAGKQTASGSMRAYMNGKRTGVIWDYRVFWDPATRRGVIQQWGFGGAYGVGETKEAHDPQLQLQGRSVEGRPNLRVDAG